MTRIQFSELELEFECENLCKHPTQGNTVYALSKGCQGLTAIKAKFERLSSVILVLLIHKTRKKQEMTWNMFH